MKEFFIKDEFIKLGQLLKAAGLCSNGADAKYDIVKGLVKVNNAVEMQRGRKIKEGDIIEYKGNELIVKKRDI